MGQPPEEGTPRVRNAPAATTSQRGSWKIFTAFTDRTPRPRPKRMLTDLFGRGARGGPDTAAAADELGISRRTVQRWVSQGLPQRSPAAAQLREQWANSPAGRKAQISPKRRAALRAAAGDGGRVGLSLQGHVWVSGDPRNGMHRGFGHIVDASEALEILQAAEDGDIDGAHERLEDALGFGAQVDLTSLSWDLRDGR